MALFRNRLSGGGVYLFDEPEAAFSPVRQIECLQSVREAEKTGGRVVCHRDPFPFCHGLSGRNPAASDAFRLNGASFSADRTFSGS